MTVLMLCLISIDESFMLNAVANGPVQIGEHGVAVCGHVAQVYSGNGIAQSKVQFVVRINVSW